MLVRPYPSLRITFTSPALRIPGLLQTKLLERVGGPAHVREGLVEALQSGTSVTARISWLTATSPPGGAGGADSGVSRGASVRGKTRWIHCTPLFGSDERVGVWMVVMVEQEEVTGLLNRQQQQQQQQVYESGGGGGGEVVTPVGAASPRFTGNKLYAEYLRREGRPATAGAGSGSAGGGSLRSRREG